MSPWFQVSAKERGLGRVFVFPFSNGLETKISRTFLDFLYLGHEFFVISGHGT